MKKTKLKIAYDFKFDLVGICCASKEYKLAYNINQVLQIRLLKKDDLNLNFLTSPMSFSNFLYETDFYKLRLLKNQALDLNKKFLIPELHQFDYLILLEDEVGIFNIDNVILQLKRISEITYVIKINPEILKSKENLIF